MCIRDRSTHSRWADPACAPSRDLYSRGDWNDDPSVRRCLRAHFSERLPSSCRRIDASRWSSLTAKVCGFRMPAAAATWTAWQGLRSRQWVTPTHESKMLLPARWAVWFTFRISTTPVSYTHLRAHETVLDLVCRL